MNKITFDNLPDAVSMLLEKVAKIELILENKSDNSQIEKDQFLTIQEAAKFLHISVPTLYGKVHNSTIPVWKKGKRLYFSQKELNAWIFQGRKKTVVEIDKEANMYISNSIRRGIG